MSKIFKIVPPELRSREDFMERSFKEVLLTLKRGICDLEDGEDFEPYLKDIASELWFELDFWQTISTTKDSINTLKLSVDIRNKKNNSIFEEGEKILLSILYSDLYDINEVVRDEVAHVVFGMQAWGQLEAEKDEPFGLLIKHLLLESYIDSKEGSTLTVELKDSLFSILKYFDISSIEVTDLPDVDRVYIKEISRARPVNWGKPLPRTMVYTIGDEIIRSIVKICEEGYLERRFEESISKYKKEIFQ